MIYPSLKNRVSAIQSRAAGSSMDEWVYYTNSKWHDVQGRVHIVNSAVQQAGMIMIDSLVSRLRGVE